MRKRRLVISLFVVLVMVFSFNLSENCMAKGKVIGLLLDGYQKDCLIHRDGKELAASKGMGLFAGDLITKKPDLKKLKISYFPYAAGKVESKTQLRIVFNPPDNETGFLERIRSLIDFETERARYEASNRGYLFYNSMKIKGDLFTYLPFPSATLFSKGEIRFYTDAGDSDQLMIYDAAETELAKIIIEDVRIKLDGSGFHLEPGKTYYWRLGNRCPYILFKVLSVEAEKVISGVLEQIAKTGKNEIEIKLNQAIYLKAISDVYPERIDLNWLSYEKLKDIVFAPGQVSQDVISMTEYFLSEIYAAKIKYAIE